MSMVPLIRFAFWVCCGILVYVYVLYPVVIRALAAGFGKALVRDDRQPTVTVVVTAYNEETSIRAKLDNLAELNYPSERLDVLVASDASSDATEQIAATYDPHRVRVLRVEGRLGKTACQNAAAAAASGEFLMFTDATTRVDPDALRHLVGSFADPKVGCVAGCLAYISDSNSPTGRGGRTYWSYELGLRAAESALGSLIGVSGCLYAVRKSAYRPIDPALISDFVVAMKMREQDLRTVLASDAACFEATLDKGSQELSCGNVASSIRSSSECSRGSYGHTRHFAMRPPFSGWALSRPTCFSFAKHRIPFTSSCCSDSPPCLPREELDSSCTERTGNWGYLGSPIIFS